MKSKAKATSEIKSACLTCTIISLSFESYTHLLSLIRATLPTINCISNRNLRQYFAETRYSTENVTAKESCSHKDMRSWSSTP
jgi:hypothetical protein